VKPVVPGALGRALTRREREEITADVRAWLRWQETLRGWRAPVSRVGALPFVALYSRGSLRGCTGNDEGGPAENLARSFLSSLGDLRLGSVRRSDRDALVAEVSYIRTARLVSRSAFPSVFEAGTHGVGLLVDGGRPVFLLPSVARDGGFDAAGMLAALDRKAASASGALFLFDTETVVVRRTRRSVKERSPLDAAARWLASLVAPDGRVTFAVDARTGARALVGEMHHGRSAAVLHALREYGGRPAVVARVERRLLADLRAALRGDAIDGWPAEPARVAGTLGLAMRAGVDVSAELVAYAEAHVTTVAAAPWHAAQVVAALGSRAPAALWKACVQDLERQPWAPWTVFAALARGEREVATRVRDALAGKIAPPGAPNAGAVIVTGRPEVALTALTVEALRATARTAASTQAIAAGRRFLLRCQVTGEPPAPFALGVGEGAFRATPTSSLLRGDVTGHAVLALL
jgi:AMMECR1 domain-containing protein